jgi:sporulation protein YlmC with PRC-barrel domain
MIQNIKELLGKTLVAKDGEMGHAEDFYFDDKNWVIRYLVANTGSWLTGRLVLISPHAFGTFDRLEQQMHVALTKLQIEESPSIDTYLPVSRQFEIEYYQYYGWPAYWTGDAMWGIGSYPFVIPPTKEEISILKKFHRTDDKHLRSTNAVIGYDIETTDGPVGTVTDLKLDDRSWVISHLVVETGSWLEGKEILIPVSKVEQINYEESMINISLTRNDLLQTEENAVAKHIKE